MTSIIDFFQRHNILLICGRSSSQAVWHICNRRSQNFAPVEPHCNWHSSIKSELIAKVAESSLIIAYVLLSHHRLIILLCVKMPEQTY